MKKQKKLHRSLRFSPTAWAKLIFMRDMTDNEVGGFGITDPDDLLLITDFVLVKQKVTSVSISFDDNAVADYFEDQVEAGRKPEQFARIWLHTHPGDSPEPSCVDEETFTRVFGNCDWSVMFIVAQNGSTYARLQFSTGPGYAIKIPVCVDYDSEFNASEFKEWKQQYQREVTKDTITAGRTKSKKYAQTFQTEAFGSDCFGELSGEDLLTQIDCMDPFERSYFLEELSIRSEFWDENESEVIYE